MLPENDELIEKSDEIIRSRPILLSDMNYINSVGFIASDKSVTDIEGNAYPAKNLFYTNSYRGSGYNECSIEFNINKKYKKFSALISPTVNYGEKAEAMVEIYGDDILLESFPIYQKTEPFTFSTDVTEVKWLKIRLTPINYNYFNYDSCILIANGEFKKSE